MSKEASATADEDPTPHPTIRLHSTNTNTNVAMTGYTATNPLDIHQYPPRRRSLLLSDSEISVLDLGPSLEFDGEEGTLRLREGKHSPRDCSRGSRAEDGKRGQGSLAVPGRQASVEESGGGGGAAVRIISSPLLSPLRTTKGNSVKVREWGSNADKGVEGKRLEEG
ncbi:uncharacterized protein CDV56_108350 [Aspergillus thermomutatus]|uniref:Uncharacterized protein n=1 Tax=Aspergillus thermomutatus TaxID=41047 RepID=A0A397H7I6_ASPTH|nr:uncharacterized protein CDV56_108350 [Aspergillus thermomutatus]RHZ58957.1 hypothetical protein CDV56_108350 [Aspergillus thermomutatus]